MHIYVSRLLSSASITVCLLVCIFLSSTAGSAHARIGQAVWLETVPEDATFVVPPLTSRESARMAAFGNAVVEEALEMLPGDITEARAELLREYLEPRASQFVLSYSVAGVETLEQGKRLTIDATLNKAALKRELKRIGIWFTVGERVTYNPQYTDVPPELWEQLGRMHILYGLSPDSSSPVTLNIAHADEQWKLLLVRKGGFLEADQTIGDATETTFTDAWHRVWGRFFAGISAEQSGGPATTLNIEGWFTPDSVEAFDRKLQSWEHLLDEASLLHVTIQPAGVSARWSLNVINPQALRRQLDTTLASQGLAYTLTDGEEN